MYRRIGAEAIGAKREKRGDGVRGRHGVSELHGRKGTACPPESWDSPERD